MGEWVDTEIADLVEGDTIRVVPPDGGKDYARGRLGSVDEGMFVVRHEGGGSEHFLVEDVEDGDIAVQVYKRATGPHLHFEKINAAELRFGDKTAVSAHDPVSRPEHYNSDPSGVECIQITRHRNFNIGNAIKYLWRAGRKDETAEIQDLQKAVWYIRDEIDRLKGEV